MIRWLKRLARVAFLLVFIFAGVAAVIVSRSLPREQGVVTLASASEQPLISADVSVRRDGAGVPHIKAKSREDAYFALGFVHAQDRLWQLEMNRRIASGELSEILGESALPTDKFIRTLGVPRAAEKQYAKLPADARAALQAYAAGVNAYIDQEMGSPPVEFWLTRSQPGHWRPTDSVAWLIIMALDLGGNFNQELMRTALARTMTTAEIWQVMPPFASDPVPESADWAALYRDLGIYRKDAKQATLPTQISPFLSAGVEGLGSNNWVVSGARSESGKPLLANDPHLGLSVPAIWHVAHLEAPDLDVIGAALPGVPGVVLGRNRRIAWGFTNTGPDVQDLYIEQIDASDAKRYRTADGFAAFETRKEIIKVKGQADISLDVRMTPRGPVVTDVLPGVADYLDVNRYQLSLRWTALDDDNSSFLAIEGLARAKNVAEAREALKFHVAPAQNVVIADVDGAIGFIAAGRIPIRKPENDLKGLAPAPGWDARYDWAGFIPFDELPQAMNPAEGMIATANQRIHAPDYPHPLTYDWTAPDRYNRIMQLLGSREKHTVASFRAMQSDVRSLAAERLLPRFRAAETASSHRLAAAARTATKNFDGEMIADAAGPLILSAFADQFARAAFLDKTPAPVANGYGGIMRDFRVALDRALQQNDSSWCDDPRTPQRETCDDLAEIAYDRALDDLSRLYGDDVANWRWGVAHAARSEHRPLGRVPFLARFFDIVVPTGGDAYTINVGRLNLNDRAAPFMNRHAASLRAIYDLNDLESSRFVYQTGQSGNVFSRRYRDFSERWARVEDLPLAMEPAGSVQELTLRVTH
ncbi:penicillin acylase family protein [Terrarubrum flagellatum]|uniref:penicillin acylase family protein n=1 Tax=Terrirubrum flagellatum TaxID=2895980 RepID=UPI003144E96F